MLNEFGAKELYEVSLKTTDIMTINGQQYERDEVFMFFQNIQISNISGSSQVATATGGKYNFTQILWDNVDSVDFAFAKGIVSMTSLNFQGQSKIGSGSVSVPMREWLITDTSGKAEISHTPSASRTMFVYKTVGGVITEKLTVLGIAGQEIDLGIANKSISILVDYYFEKSDVCYQEIGGENIQGYFKLTSKINFIDEKDGTKSTVLFVMPKVKILSNINLTFGVKANPIVANLRMRALPDDRKALARFIYLNQDIEG